MMTPVSDWFAGEAVALPELLAARERRAAWQRQLRGNRADTQIVLSVLTPGAVKNHAFSRAVFAAGQDMLARLIKARGWTLHASASLHEAAGEMACWSVDAPPDSVKRLLLSVEERLPLGRLWDMDVLDGEGKPLSRRQFGYAPRRCLLCAQDAKICARERRHALHELQAAMLVRWQWQAHAARIAASMCSALQREACLTPKPGLVDAENHACHPDMDVALLIQSAQTIAPFLATMAALGMMHAGSPSPALLHAIRPVGKAAERAMLVATSGVNTHKGAVFAFGLWAAVLGWRYRHGLPFRLDEACAQVAALAAQLPAELGMAQDSAGQRLFHAHGLGGARAEAAAGYPLLPRALSAFADAPFADDGPRWLLALLALIAGNDDTTTVTRGGMDGLREAQAQAAQLYAKHRQLDDARALVQAVRDFDAWATERRLSFGGSADLLALAMFLHDYGSLTITEIKEDGLNDILCIAECLSFP